MYDKIVKLVFTIILITQPMLIAKEKSNLGGQRLLTRTAEIKSCACGMNHRLGVSIGRDGERTITDTISYYTGPSYVEDYSNFMSDYQTTGDDSVVTRIHLLTAGVINQYHVMSRVIDPDGNVADD